MIIIEKNKEEKDDMHRTISQNKHEYTGACLTSWT